MAEIENNERGSSERTLRLWPGAVIVALQWIARFLVPMFVIEATPYGVLAALLGGLGVGLWWMFFSRAARGERWLAFGLTLVALAATPLVLHESVATGMQGLMFIVYATPVLSLAFVAWALMTRQLSAKTRRVTMIATFAIACGAWALVRTGGFTGYLDQDFAWRWTPTPEEILLANESDEPVQAAAPSESQDGEEPGADWPGFRGPRRDGVVSGSRIDQDWSASPPTEMWRHPIGPGWSSFAVHGGRLFTQEQRGESEVVSCYDLRSGLPVWRHEDETRFWESNGGAGPRGTPTFGDGRLFTLGATGVVNVLEAVDGTVVWSRNAADDTTAEVPEWGFSGSPLLVDDLVVVAAAGFLVAYDAGTGELRWNGPTSGGGYSSPQLATLGGVEQILLVSEPGVSGVEITSGKLLWEHEWSGDPIVQPALTEDGDLLISVNALGGLRRLAVTREAGNWSVAERWTTTRLKPYFNDFVVHAGNAYGLDSGILTCVDLAGGKRQWKGGRYGHGQLILLSDQGLLLILTEEGEIALAEATPEEFIELARSPAIESKTWNHPVLVGDILLVRNAEEMAAFRLAVVEE